MDHNNQESHEEELTDEELSKEVKKMLGAAKVLDLIHELFINTNRNRRLNHLPQFKWDDFYDKTIKEQFSKE
jgi:hypothetical protein